MQVPVQNLGLENASEGNIFEMLQPLRSNTKQDTRAHTIQQGLCGQGCCGLRFYSVILPFERQILQMNGHSNGKSIVPPFILPLTGLPSMSRGQAQHFLSFENYLPQDVFRNCHYHSPHHNEEKIKTVNLLTIPNNFFLYMPPLW